MSSFVHYHFPQNIQKDFLFKYFALLLGAKKEREVYSHSGEMCVRVSVETLHYSPLHGSSVYPDDVLCKFRDFLDGNSGACLFSRHFGSQSSFSTESTGVGDAALLKMCKSLGGRVVSPDGHVLLSCNRPEGMLGESAWETSDDDVYEARMKFLDSVMLLTADDIAVGASLSSQAGVADTGYARQFISASNAFYISKLMPPDSMPLKRANKTV